MQWSKKNAPPLRVNAIQKALNAMDFDQVHRDHGRSGSTTRGFLRQGGSGGLDSLPSEHIGDLIARKEKLRLVGVYKGHIYAMFSSGSDFP